MTRMDVFYYVGWNVETSCCISPGVEVYIYIYRWVILGVAGHVGMSSVPFEAMI